MQLPMVAAMCALLTWLAIRYARWRSLLDLPGQRRSHATPTARGGGIAIVLTVLTFAALANQRPERACGQDLLALTALGMVALIGWVDDHRPLSPWLRLAVHSVAAALLLAATALDVTAWVLLLAMLAMVAAINLCNFMDGINGLATSQAAIVAAALGAAFVLAGQSSWSGLALVFAAACAGFLPFNFPRARIFLGDVGSGFLGVMVGWLLWSAWRSGSLPFGAVLLLPSAFLLDAGLTLSRRVFSGKRWYRPHREHLYQWLVRRGMSHSRVTTMYAGWTLASAALALALRDNGSTAAAAAIGLYVLGAALWLGGKRLLLRGARKGAHR